MARESAQRSFSKAVICGVSGAITPKVKARKRKCFFIKISAQAAESVGKNARIH